MRRSQAHEAPSRSPAARPRTTSTWREHLIDYGRVGFIQIDCGRIGGIGPAKQVADYAVARGVTYVNHTFTSHLALSASLQPYAGLAEHRICEYPFAAASQLAVELTSNHLSPTATASSPSPRRLASASTIDEEALARYPSRSRSRPRDGCSMRRRR